MTTIELDHCDAPVVEPANDDQPVQPLRQWGPRWIRANKGLIAVVAAVLAAAGTIVAVQLTQPEPQKPVTVQMTLKGNVAYGAGGVHYNDGQHYPINDTDTEAHPFDIVVSYDLSTPWMAQIDFYAGSGEVPAVCEIKIDGHLRSSGTATNGGAGSCHWEQPQSAS